MSKFKSFMSATGEVLGAMAEAHTESKKVPVHDVANAVNGIDWDSYRVQSVLYGLTDEEYQTLREAAYILNKFPRK